MFSPAPPLALLAGGLATRLRPITVSVPKSMISVAGRPFIAHQLDLIVQNGVREVVLCCGFLGDQIEEFVGSGKDFGCTVYYSYDGTALKGTGGAIRKALPLLGEQFFVMYGDSYLPASFREPFEAFAASGKRGLMTVFLNDNRWDKSNVEFVDGQIRNYDKRSSSPEMRYIDYGLGILNSSAFCEWKTEETFDLADVYRQLVAQGQLSGFEVVERFYEIGTPEGLAETDSMLRERAAKRQ
jgi:N-acetyl-alpha-D-muramate 1-phosphate uridylyltransferase